MGSLHHSDIVTQQPINSSISDSGDDHLQNNILHTHLHKAAKAGNTDNFISELQKFTITPATIFKQSTPLKNTLLHIAASFNNPDILIHLLEQFPDILNRVNYKGDTALHISAREGHLEVVKILVNFVNGDLESGGLSISLLNEDGNTPLHEAIIHGREKVVDFFLQVSCSKEYSFGFYVNNNEGKSPLYLAVEAQNVKSVNSMLDYGLSHPHLNNFHEQIISGMSLIHAAIAAENLVLLQKIASALVYDKAETMKNSLHSASSIGFLDGVKYLLNEFDMDAFEKDGDGFCPIHLASKNGHVEVIQYFLQLYPDAREFLDSKRKNILHVAAENGKDDVVRSILKSPESELLLNQRDEEGNTSLHLATREWYPKVVSSLTWDKRVNVKLANKEGLTALEVAETEMDLVMPPFRQRLTWMALMSAGAARAEVKDTATIKKLKAAKYEPYSLDYCKDKVNTLLLVSTIIGTITFAAFFAIPGGSNISNNPNLITFILCDFLAFCSTITIVGILMWAQLGDLKLSLNALRRAQKCLGFSITMTNVAIVVGAHYLAANSDWLSILILTMGILSIMSLQALFVPLFLPYMSRLRFARYISYYPFYLLMMASESSA